MVDRLPMIAPSIAGYEYQSPLGRGGFADVFLYTQSTPYRQLAIKVFVKKLKSGTVEEKLFIKEAEKLAQFSGHPNIVTLIEANVSRDGYPYLAMEYCPETLGKSWRTNPLPLDVVLDFGVQLACALEVIHRAGIVHRDIKPSNILISSVGSPKLADFGIAEMAAADGNDEKVAMSLPWSAPEIVSMQRTGSVEADIWSLGATLYSLLAGRSPFELPNSNQNANDLLSKRIVKAIYTPIPRSGIPSLVDNFLNKAMYRDPQKRWGSMQEFAMALNEIQQQLQFPVTKLTIPTKLADLGGRPEGEKYPCGHPKVDASGIRRSVVQTESTNRRNKTSEGDQTDECLICKAASSKGKPKKVRKKVSPLTWIILGALAAGFLAAYFITGAAGH